MGQLTFIGLGLYDEKDISIKGLEAAKEADTVYLEFYTSNLAGCNIEDVKAQLNKRVKILSREDVENKALPVEEAEDKKVVFLTAGDPMAATTHVDLRLRAEKEGIETKLIHSSSIFSAVPSQLGLQHYKFGRTVTLPFIREEKDYPASPYQNIAENKERGLHSLVLLDIDSKDQRYMDVDEGIQALIELENRFEQKVIEEKTLLAGLARVGSKNPEIRADYPKKLKSHEFGEGLHSLVVFGDLHFMEIDSLISLADAPEEIREEE